MFLDQQSASERKKYTALLKAVGSISKLFSDSTSPYLYYRAHENIFCKAFTADNHSRADLSVDAVKAKFGIGVKTYLDINEIGSFQKIAEFNAHRGLYAQQKPEEAAKTIAYLRNQRIEFAARTYALEQMLYHCVARREGEMLIFETDMPLIKIEKIKISKATEAAIHFEDGIGEYNFSLSKSTLLKRFYTPKNSISINVPILEDPFSVLDVEEEEELIPELFEKNRIEKKSIVLPLYSARTGKVEEKSGLNQWNAGGRKRDKNEVYIPIPSWIRETFKGFFPSREVEFKLRLPNGRDLKASICQGGDKALMSDPNSDLGFWLLRQGLQLKEGQLATYKHLQTIGVDSVVIVKNCENDYSIDFRPIGSYEEFEILHKPKK